MVTRSNISKASKSIRGTISKVKDDDVQRAASVNPIAMDVALRVVQQGALALKLRICVFLQCEGRLA